VIISIVYSIKTKPIREWQKKLDELEKEIEK
jgi:hypothetical protein